MLCARIPAAEAAPGRAMRNRRTDERREYEREWKRRQRAKDPEAARAYDREYKRRNPKPRTDQRREYEREWARRRREADPEASRAYGRERWTRNRDALNERRRAVRERSPESVRESQRRNYAKNRSRILSRNKKLAHGPYIFEDLAAMWDAQQGLCYLCGCDLNAVKRVVIDHDHSCCPPDHSCRACRRGLSCDGCNIGIGMVGDDPDRLRRMADALEVAQKAAKARIAALSVQMELFPLEAPSAESA